MEPRPRTKGRDTLSGGLVGAQLLWSVCPADSVPCTDPQNRAHGERKTFSPSGNHCSKLWTLGFRPCEPASWLVTRGHVALWLPGV